MPVSREDFDMTTSIIGTNVAPINATAGIIGVNGALINETADILGGYLALGYKDNCSYVYSYVQQRTIGLRPSHMNEMTLKSVCGADWCDAYYTELHPKKEVRYFDHRALATNIISDCQRVGLYNDDCERRFGIWPSQDGKSLYINGNQLWRNDGGVVETGFVDGKVYPRSGDVGFGPDTPPATPEEINRVLAALGVYDWATDMVPEMLLGWLVCAFVAPALPRRPHVYFTGAAGVGKSVMLEMVANLLGPLAHKASGPQSKAGLYQSLGGTPRAVVLDEAEADSSNRRWSDMLEIARIAYSFTEGDKGLVVGSQTGVPRGYRFFAPFFAAGITPAKFEPADLTRWTIVEAKGRKADAEKHLLREAESRTLGARIAALVVRRWSVLQASLEVIRDTIMRQGGDARLADTVGPLLAGYWCVVSSSPATPADAETLVGFCQLRKQLEQREETDEKRCLEALLSRVVTVPVMEETCLVKIPLSIGETIARICADPAGQMDLQHRLSQSGIRVTYQKGRWVVMVAASPEHTELRKLFRGSKWQHGGWATTLRRLPGGMESTQRLGYGFKVCKVSMFDVPEELLPDTDESDELLAA